MFEKKFFSVISVHEYGHHSVFIRKTVSKNTCIKDISKSVTLLAKAENSVVPLPHWFKNCLKQLFWELSLDKHLQCPKECLTEKRLVTSSVNFGILDRDYHPYSQAPQQVAMGWLPSIMVQCCCQGGQEGPCPQKLGCKLNFAWQFTGGAGPGTSHCFNSHGLKQLSW